ncbi:hypothetical protein BH09ACT3_BH09ACT3_05060 [soil metagenome]
MMMAAATRYGEPTSSVAEVCVVCSVGTVGAAE